jgi:bifunctional non-homologous end joining protein LigD
MSSAKLIARFVEPMLLEPVAALPDNRAEWLYQLKLDGYRAIAFKSGGVISLRSRNENDFSLRYTSVMKALAKLPNETVIDGEIVALSEDGRSSFNLLQNHGSTHPNLFYYVFDVLVLAGKDVRGESLTARLALLEIRVLPKLSVSIRPCVELESDLTNLVRSVRKQGLEGLVAKRRDSVYEPGGRSGAWQKMRVNQGRELVIGGYTIGGKTFDALAFGYYENGNLLYASRPRNGFTPALREDLFKKMKPLQIEECPFRQSARASRRTLGEGEGLSMAQAGAGVAIRTRRVDRGWASPPPPVCCASRGQACARGEPGGLVGRRSKGSRKVKEFSKAGIPIP